MENLQSLVRPSSVQGLQGDPSALVAVRLTTLENALKPSAQNPGEAKEREQHHQAQVRRGIAHDLLRDLAEGIAGGNNCTGPYARRNEVEHQESGPGQRRHPVGEARDTSNAMRVAMEQDHPDMVTVRQLGCSLDGAFKPWKGPKPARTKSPPDPEPDHITCEAAEPAEHNQSPETQRARMGGVTGE